MMQGDLSLHHILFILQSANEQQTIYRGCKQLQEAIRR